MPFGYFGAKHGLARFYPPPKYRTVIEPFAGAAGYSVYWAKQGLIDHVILIDSNPHVIALWRRLQSMTYDGMMAIECPPKGTRICDPLIGGASGRQGMCMMAGKYQAVTDRMHHNWYTWMRRRIAQSTTVIRSWDVIQGDYTSAPDVEAVWFIDAAKMGTGSRPGLTAGGFDYREHGGQFSSHQNLAEFCLSRNGQVIVCEQDPAGWLPFQPFRRLRNGVGAGTYAVRQELIWTRHRTRIDG